MHQKKRLVCTGILNCLSPKRNMVLLQITTTIAICQRTFDEQRWQSLHPIRKVEANMSAHCCRQAMLRRSAVAASLTRAVTLSGPSPASRHGFINHRRGLRSTAMLMQFDATPILRAAEGVAASAEGGTQGGEGGGSQGARLVGIVFFSSLVRNNPCVACSIPRICCC